MASLSNASRLCMRAASKPAAGVRAISSTAVKAGAASAAYTSPFKGSESSANKVPDFGKYVSQNSPAKNKLFSYFMVGTMGALTAAGAKSTVSGA